MKGWRFEPGDLMRLKMPYNRIILWKERMETLEGAKSAGEVSGADVMLVVSLNDEEALVLTSGSRLGWLEKHLLVWA